MFVLASLFGTQVDTCVLLISKGYEDIILLLKKHGGDLKITSSMGQRPGGKGLGLGSEFDIKTPFYEST
mgnify:CR=1 FL=1